MIRKVEADEIGGLVSLIEKAIFDLSSGMKTAAEDLGKTESEIEEISLPEFNDDSTQFLENLKIDVQDSEKAEKDLKRNFEQKLNRTFSVTESSGKNVGKFLQVAQQTSEVS